MGLHPMPGEAIMRPNTSTPNTQMIIGIQNTKISNTSAPNKKYKNIQTLRYIFLTQMGQHPMPGKTIMQPKPKNTNYKTHQTIQIILMVNTFKKIAQR